MLDGRRILVTGASSGIGRALGLAYAAQGATVFAVARTEEPLRLAAATALAGRISPVPADLASEAGRRGAATAVAHAGGVLDVVVHAAGTLGPVGDAGRLRDYPAAEWYRVLEVNLSAVHFLHQHLAPYLDRGHRPAVIGVSSTVGRRGRAGWGMYAVSKHALEGWMQVLADEWADRGRVYSVNPGATRTPMRAAAMPGEDPATLPAPQEITPLFLRLAHPAAPEPSGSLLEARDWIGRDPWEGLGA
ncbi:MAG: SDR family NAD(P)-dependent oxidoreductase [Acidimicrobiia bacterium]|nr:SDR family NAD(P)-dependent oxidoreductase [Acidimicrobiia bacterium]